MKSSVSRLNLVSLEKAVMESVYLRYVTLRYGMSQM